jgi:hypothetical protein
LKILYFSYIHSIMTWHNILGWLNLQYQNI